MTKKPALKKDNDKIPVLKKDNDKIHVLKRIMSRNTGIKKG